MEEPEVLMKALFNNIGAVHRPNCRIVSTYLVQLDKQSGHTHLTAAFIDTFLRLVADNWPFHRELDINFADPNFDLGQARLRIESFVIEMDKDSFDWHFAESQRSLQELCDAKKA